MAYGFGVTGGPGGPSRNKRREVFSGENVDLFLFPISAWEMILSKLWSWSKERHLIAASALTWCHETMGYKEAVPLTHTSQKNGQV